MLGDESNVTVRYVGDFDVSDWCTRLAILNSRKDQANEISIL